MVVIVFCDGGGSGKGEETFTEARSVDAGGAAEINGGAAGINGVSLTLIGFITQLTNNIVQ
ncbi:unnamed protein product [Brassica rapa subsp. narinosa]